MCPSGSFWCGAIVTRCTCGRTMEDTGSAKWCSLGNTGSHMPQRQLLERRDRCPLHLLGEHNKILGQVESAMGQQLQNTIRIPCFSSSFWCGALVQRSRPRLHLRVYNESRDFKATMQASKDRNAICAACNYYYSAKAPQAAGRSKQLAPARWRAAGWRRGRWRPPARRCGGGALGWAPAAAAPPAPTPTPAAWRQRPRSSVLIQAQLKARERPARKESPCRQLPNPDPRITPSGSCAII